MFFIQRLTLAQSMYLKEIWGYLTHDEQELFEVINKNYWRILMMSAHKA